MSFCVGLLAACAPQYTYSELRWPDCDPLVYDVTLTRISGGQEVTHNVVGLQAGLSLVGREGWRVISSKEDKFGTTFQLEKKGGGRPVRWRAIPRRRAL
jgi:hypothetical protein